MAVSQKAPSERDRARSYFKSSGLSYGDLTTDRIKVLHKMLDEKMRASGLMKNSYRMAKLFKSKKRREGVYFDLTCCSFYFEGRQAVTFEPNGFIGFAGWSDDENVVPILEAFKEWVDYLVNEKQRNGAIMLQMPWHRSPQAFAIEKAPDHNALQRKKTS